MKEYKLKELFDLQMGKTPSRNNVDYWNDPVYKWISIGDLSNSGKYISETKEYLSEKAVNESGISIIPENTVIMSFKLSIGKTAITSEPMYSNEAIMSFRDKHITELMPDYIYYLLLSKDWEAGTNKAVMGKTLNKAMLSEIRVEIHDIVEQKRIVSILNKLGTIIEKRKVELQKLDELIKARFVEMFLDKNLPLVALDDLSIGKGEYGAQSASASYNPLRPRYVRITDITDDGSLNDDCVSSVNIEDDEKYKLEYGDFLFARMGSVGKTYAYLKGNQIFAGYLIRYKLDLRKILPEYLYAYTCLDEYKLWVELNKSGAVQPGINAKKYGMLTIPVASLSEQIRFSEFKKQVDKEKAVVNDSLNKYRLLLDSLIQEYFS